MWSHIILKHKFADALDFGVSLYAYYVYKIPSKSNISRWYSFKDWYGYFSKIVVSSLMTCVLIYVHVHSDDGFENYVLLLFMFRELISCSSKISFYYKNTVWHRGAKRLWNSCIYWDSIHFKKETELQFWGIFANY